MFDKIKSFFNNTNITKLQQTENEKAKEILNDFEKLPNIDKFPNLYKILFIDDIMLKEKIIKTIINFSSTLKPEQLLQLHDIFRERTSFDWNSNVDWKNININELLIENMSEFEKIYFIGIASFHPNGYFREKCLNELIKYNSGVEITFLIIKLTDWVQIIKNKAQIELEKRINNENITYIIQNLHLLYKLKEKKRNNNDKIITLSKQLLLKFDSFEQILPDLQNVSKKTKQFCYEILMCRKLTIEIMINYAKNEKELGLKYFLYVNILKKYNKELIYNYVSAILNDGDNKIKAELLFYILKNKDENLFLDVFKKCLMCGNFETRSRGRTVVSKFEKIDFSKYYISKLNENPVIAIAGLSEVGDKNDCDVLKSCLDNKNKKIIKAVLKALSILDYSGNLNIFLKYSESEYKSISNFSAKIIESKINEFNETDIYSIYKTTTNENVKFNSMKLLTKIPKWNSIVYILEFIESENEIVKKEGFKYLLLWENNFNKSLTICSGKIKEKIRNAVCNSKNLDESQKKILYFML